MKSEAIRCAIKLHSEPTLLARFNDPFRKLPRGITELLRIVSSDIALKNISLRNNLHAPQLKKVLVNYIQLVLLPEGNSNRRKLGVDRDSDFSQVKLHYKLLINIFHPDKSNDYIDPKFSQIILRAYKNLQHNTKNNSSISKVNSPPLNPKHYYPDKRVKLSKAKQKCTLNKIGLLKSGIITILVMACSLILLMPSSPKLISKKKLENSEIKTYGRESLGWKNPRARNNTQREITKVKLQ